MTRTSAQRSPRTQAQRRSDTRQRLLDATNALLVEVGYARTSTWAVCARAGVSRGGLLHHFPTRTSLFTAAVAHLAQTPLDTLDAQLAANPTRGVAILLDWLWSTLDGPLFSVGLELLTAARTEPELRDVLREGGDALQKQLQDVVRTVVRRAGQAEGGDLETALLLSIPAVRGIGLDLTVGGDRQRHRQTFDRWRVQVERLAAGGT